MSPSPELEPLPPALSSMWRLCKLGYRHEPRLMVVSFVLSQLAALPDALLALWLALLGNGFLFAFVKTYHICKCFVDQFIDRHICKLVLA